MLATSSARPRRPSGCSSSSHCRPRHVADGLAEAGRDHRRVDVARMHRVAADVVFHLRAMQRHVLGERAHRALAGAVGHRIGGAAQAEHRGDVDDRAAARLLHRRDRGLAAEERAQRIDVVDPAVFRERAVLDRVAHADAGGIQQAVQAAERLDAGGDRLLPARFVGDVERHEQRRARPARPRARDPWPRRGRPAPPCRPRARPAGRSRRRCPTRRRSSARPCSQDAAKGDLLIRPDGQPAVGHDLRAGDEARAVRGEPQHDLAEIDAARPCGRSDGASRGTPCPARGPSSATAD